MTITLRPLAQPTALRCADCGRAATCMIERVADGVTTRRALCDDAARDVARAHDLLWPPLTDADIEVP